MIEGEGGALAGAVAAGIADGGEVVIEAEGGDAVGGEGEELPVGGAAIAVVVGPEEELGPGEVGGGDGAVEVGVELGEGLEAVTSVVAGGEERRAGWTWT